METVYYHSGDIEIEASYANGKLHGLYREFYYPDKNYPAKSLKKEVQLNEPSKPPLQRDYRFTKVRICSAGKFYKRCSGIPIFQKEKLFQLFIKKCNTPFEVENFISAGVHETKKIVKSFF